MKKVMALILVAAMAACTQKPAHVADRIVNEIEGLTLYDTLGDGGIVYFKSYVGRDILKKENENIGIIERNLGIVAEPKKGTGYRYTYKTWNYNTPEVNLKVQSTLYVYQDSCYFRMWIFKK